MTDIERNNRIDEYLIGAMPEDEKAAFEKELRENENLRSEVDAQRTIAEAVQTAHLKNMLADVEADLQRKRILRRVITWTSSAAASIVIILSGYSIRQSNVIKTIGDMCFTELTPPVSRDGNSLDSLLTLAYSQIAANEYSAATSALAEARLQIEDGLKTPAADEESRYRHTLLRQHLYDVDWLEAITLMMQGRDRKARRLLKSIANSQSPYSGKACEILNLYYLDK